MTTEWANLPNAKHIDRILADIKKNPDKWTSAWDATRIAAWIATVRDARADAQSAARADVKATARDAAWRDARDAVYDVVYDAAYNIAYNEVKHGTIFAAYDIARDATMALVAWDDCAYLLDEKPEDVKLLALLGNQAAQLIYPVCSCVALQKETA